MKVGSLFAGIGGFDLGLERAGFTTAWFCEQDAFCQQVLAKHWPGVPIYEDICELKGADVEPVDILCGGFPCQDLSYAGRGAGIEGERSGLWTEYARLIGELRPRYVLVENVPALLTRGLGRVLGDLAALGYDAEWDCIPASAVGAPHRRDRIWLVAYADGERTQVSAAGKHAAEQELGSQGGAWGLGQLADSNGADCKARSSDRMGAQSQAELGSLRRGRGESGTVPHSDSPRLERHGRLVEGAGERPAPSRGLAQRERERSNAWAVEPDMGRVADGVPARVDRLKALGNALVPQVAEWIGCRIQEWEEGVK